MGKPQAANLGQNWEISRFAVVLRRGLRPRGGKPSRPRGARGRTSHGGSRVPPSAKLGDRGLRCFYGEVCGARECFIVSDEHPFQKSVERFQGSSPRWPTSPPRSDQLFLLGARSPCRAFGGRFGLQRVSEMVQGAACFSHEPPGLPQEASKAPQKLQEDP